MATRLLLFEQASGEDVPSERQMIEWLEIYAKRGPEKWRRALGAARGKKSGRQAIDDHASLVEMAFLIETGEANSPEAAARLVAATLPARQSRESAAKRLARKYRRNFADETN